MHVESENGDSGLMNGSSSVGVVWKNEDKWAHIAAVGAKRQVDFLAPLMSFQLHVQGLGADQEAVRKVLREGGDVLVDVDPAHPAVSAYYGCVYQRHHGLTLKWEDVVWNAEAPLPLFDSDSLTIEDAPIVLVKGDETSRTIAIWLNCADGLPAEPDLAALTEVAGEPICALAHVERGVSVAGRPGRQVAAFVLLLDRLEKEYMKGHRIVIALSADPLAALWIGIHVYGLGRFPCVKFVEADPTTGELVLGAQR